MPNAASSSNTARVTGGRQRAGYGHWAAEQDQMRADGLVVFEAAKGALLVPETGVGRAFLERRIIAIDDVLEAPEFSQR